MGKIGFLLVGIFMVLGYLFSGNSVNSEIDGIFMAGAIPLLFYFIFYLVFSIVISFSKIFIIEMAKGSIPIPFLLSFFVDDLIKDIKTKISKTDTGNKLMGHLEHIDSKTDHLINKYAAYFWKMTGFFTLIITIFMILIFNTDSSMLGIADIGLANMILLAIIPIILFGGKFIK